MYRTATAYRKTPPMRPPFPLLLCLLSPAAAAAADATPPNIVFIIADDHAWTDYGFMGHAHIETPNLDTLAERSAVFARGCVPTVLCRPALATLDNVAGFWENVSALSSKKKRET